MSLMRFQRRAMTLRQRLMLTIGLILLVFQLISTFWLWHESTEQIQLFEQALRDNRNNDRHIMHEIREAVASLIVPGVFMVSLTLLICYQAVRRITRPLAELQKELEARTADNLAPIAIHSSTLEIESVVSAINQLVPPRSTMNAFLPPMWPMSYARRCRGCVCTWNYCQKPTMLMSRRLSPVLTR